MFVSFWVEMLLRYKVQRNIQLSEEVNSKVTCVPEVTGDHLQA
jgi:hypothetical protein